MFLWHVDIHFVQEYRKGFSKIPAVDNLSVGVKHGEVGNSPLTYDWCIIVTSRSARWRLKSPASRLFTQLFTQTQIKENIKAPRHWRLCGEVIGDR